MNNKVFFRILLGISALFLVYICIDSVVTPIRFEEKRTVREAAIVKNLIAIRTAQAEYKLVKGYYTADLDSLILFLKTTPKKEVLKEGSLTDKQLEAGLTEHKAAKMMERAIIKAKVKTGMEDVEELYKYVWENDREIIENNLVGFRRDTINKNMIETIYKGAYTEQTINDIIYVPYSNHVKFELETNNNYTTSQGILIPLFEARAHFNIYLSDLDAQELVNLIDKEEKLEHYPGLKVGDINAPNNNAGNWE